MHFECSLCFKTRSCLRDSRRGKRNRGIFISVKPAFALGVSVFHTVASVDRSHVNRYIEFVSTLSIRSMLWPTEHNAPWWRSVEARTTLLQISWLMLCFHWTVWWQPQPHVCALSIHSVLSPTDHNVPPSHSNASTINWFWLLEENVEDNCLFVLCS